MSVILVVSHFDISDKFNRESQSKNIKLAFTILVIPFILISNSLVFISLIFNVPHNSCSSPLLIIDTFFILFSTNVSPNILKFSLFLLILSFFIIDANLKKCGEECPDQIKEILDEITEKKNSLAQFKESGNYYFTNKNVKVNRTSLKLTMNFDGIQTRTEEKDFNVVYTAKFYDREKLGIYIINDYIQEPSLYNYSIAFSGDEAKKNIDWEVEIQKNDEKYQIVQIDVNANSSAGSEMLAYNSFTFKYGKEKQDRTFEFWLIFGCMNGIVVLTFIAMTIYFACKGELGRPSVQAKKMQAGLVSGDSIADSSNPEYSGFTS